MQQIKKKYNLQKKGKKQKKLNNASWKFNVTFDVLKKKRGEPKLELRFLFILVNMMFPLKKGREKRKNRHQL
jgi:hypothetical protein